MSFTYDTLGRCFRFVYIYVCIAVLLSCYRFSVNKHFILRVSTDNKPTATRYRPGRGETICPPGDGSSTRGGSTSVRGRVRSPHISGGGWRWLSCRQPACLQPRQLRHGTNRPTDGSRYSNVIITDRMTSYERNGNASGKERADENATA